jgi:uncharacterized protein YceK
MKLRNVAIAATVLLLTGCSSVQPASTSAPESPSVTSSPSTTHQPTSAPLATAAATMSPVPAAAEQVTVTPQVDADQQSADDAAFLAALGEIDAGLAHDRSIGRAANVCLDIEQGKDDKTVIANMESRFQGGTVPNLDVAQLAMLLSAIKDTCG